jgi:transposase
MAAPDIAGVALGLGIYVEAVLMETRQVKGALKAMPVKTDRRDAEGIAHLLRMGWFRAVHCKSASAQEVRALLTARKLLLGKMLDIELGLRGVLRGFGLKIGKVSRGRFAARVRELVAGNPMLEHFAQAMLTARETLRAEMTALDRRARAHAREDATCRLLMTAPGVGVLTALTFKSAVDDPGRFRSSKMVGALFGLTPSKHQSGEKDVTGAITRAGDGMARRAVARRRGRKRATVAVARKLAVILHRMWIDDSAFRFGRAAPPDAVAA